MNSPLLLPPCRARTCNIVTLYEDFASALRAYQVFDRLERRFGNGLPVIATSWSFPMLGMSRLAASVLQESGSADVLIVSANGNKDLPPHVAVWVERCISRGRNAGPVLVALVDGELEARGWAARFSSSLEQIATRHQARFLRNRDLREEWEHDLPIGFGTNGSRGPVRETLGRPVVRAPRRCSIHE